MSPVIQLSHGEPSCFVDPCRQWQKLLRCGRLVDQPEAGMEAAVYGRWWTNVWQQTSWPVGWAGTPAGGHWGQGGFNWAGTRRHIYSNVGYFKYLHVKMFRISSPSQVADLDDDFAELLLTDFSDNFDAVPSVKVSVVLHGTTIR